MPKSPIKRYCVMCLVDGDKAAATHIIDGAGYCPPCLAAMERTGNGPAYTLAEYERHDGHKHRKLSQAQRIEIAATSRLMPATVLARKYGVTGQTIANIRKEFPEEGPMREDLPPPVEVLAANLRFDHTPKPEAEPTPQPDDPPASTVPDDSLAEAWDVTLTVPSDRVDDIFATFTTQEKFNAIGHVLQRRLDDALSD